MDTNTELPEDIDYNSIEIENPLESSSTSDNTETEKKAPQKEKGESKKVVEEDGFVDDEEDEKKSEENSEESNEDDEVLEDSEEEELVSLEEKNRWMKKRLGPVKDKLEKANTELARLQAEVESLKAGKSQQPAPQVPQEALESLDAFVTHQVDSDPSIKKLQTELDELLNNANGVDNFIQKVASLEARLDVRREMVAEKVKAEVENSQNLAAQEEARILSEYDAKVDALKEVHPKIEKAKSRLIAKAADLHLEIRKAIIFDDNAGELTWKIGQDPKNIEFLIEASKAAEKTGQYPIEALKYLGRLSASIESKDSKEDKPKTPVAPDRKKNVPKNIKSSQVGNSNEPDDLNDWAEKAVRENRRPW